MLGNLTLINKHEVGYCQPLQKSLAAMIRELEVVNGEKVSMEERERKGDLERQDMQKRIKELESKCAILEKQG